MNAWNELLVKLCQFASALRLATLLLDLKLLVRDEIRDETMWPFCASLD
jgi:hypothetical protein